MHRHDEDFVPSDSFVGQSIEELLSLDSNSTNQYENNFTIDLNQEKPT